MQRTTILALGGAAITATVLAALLLVPGQVALSADHFDPASRTDPLVDATPDFDADIADLYAFHDADNVYIIETWGAPAATNLAGFFDRDIIHTIKISTEAPATSADVIIRTRFGKGANPGEMGVEVSNLPGVNGSIVGPLEKILSKDGVRVFSGVRDDPFFFDAQGLRESRTMGTIRFDKTRDRFAGGNASVLVLSIPRSRLGTNPLDLSVETSRFGGQL